MKQYAVVEQKPMGLGLIPTGYYWAPIMDTNDIGQAMKCRKNWQSFTGHKIIVVDFATGEVVSY